MKEALVIRVKRKLNSTDVVDVNRTGFAGG